jgi:anaerobic dimethyl sulfoxide reductase subunit C (anchor subunit)
MMLPHEWPLIVFTLLSQMAVGAFLVVWLVHWRARQQAGEIEANKLCRGALLGVGPLIVIGLLASLFHLGSPLDAPNAISNLGTSWLSREVFLAVLFALMWCVCAFLQWRTRGTDESRMIWATLTAVAGLLFVFSSSMSYLLPTRPGWANPSTPLFFFGSTFLLGALAAATIFAIHHLRTGRLSEAQTALVKMALSTSSVVVMVVVVVQAFAILYQVSSLIEGTAQANASAQLLLGANGLWFWVRILLGILAAFVLAAWTWRALERSAKTVPALATNLVFLTFVLVLIAEMIGRFLLFVTVVPVTPLG